MAFTMHSHSGQFCPGHAKDQLEDIIQHAISLGYKTMGLTEHMPRLALVDLYPEELDDPEASLAVLKPRHEAYLTEAVRLRDKYAPQISLLVGFEGEWPGLGREAEYGPYVLSLAADPRVDYFIGSVHHLDNHPIDFDQATYDAAVHAVVPPNGTNSGGTGGEVTAQQEEAFFEAYYDRQHDMLAALRPQVVGHFDLVRLLSRQPGHDVRAWNGVWSRIERNLQLVKSYGGWLECNTAALRKGLAEAYPCRPIAEAWIRMGGKFTMSDDSHGIAQVATNYLRGLDYLESLGVSEVWTLERPAKVDGTGVAKQFTHKNVSLTEFRSSLKLP